MRISSPTSKRPLDMISIKRILLMVGLILLLLDPAVCFSTQSTRRRSFVSCQSINHRSSFHGDCVKNTEPCFDPLNFSSRNDHVLETSQELPQKDTTIATLAIVPLVASLPNAALAASSSISSGDFNPQNFQPICSASDGFYRFLQGTTQAVVGPENFVEYGPLIAGGLLRIRLELCVVESFFNEAVVPFIRENGISWILPLHETVETFLAGVIFSLATTFILVGSSKILAVIITYADAFVGGPCRLFGGFAFDRALGKPVTLDIGFGPFKKRIVGPPSEGDEKKDDSPSDILADVQSVEPAGLPVVLVSGSVKALGETSKFLREVIEGIDTFVGRYLVLYATAYIAIKFLHYKVFPDFP